MDAATVSDGMGASCVGIWSGSEWLSHTDSAPRGGVPASNVRESSAVHVSEELAGLEVWSRSYSELKSGRQSSERAVPDAAIKRTLDRNPWSRWKFWLGGLVSDAVRLLDSCYVKYLTLHYLTLIIAWMQSHGFLILS
jgi:hypothetical protein